MFKARSNSYCTLLIVLFSLVLAEATEYYVRPTEGEEISCPGQPCLTMNQYSHPSTDYLKSNNTIFTFLPGTHTLERPLELSDVANVTFQGATKGTVELKTSFKNNVSEYADEFQCSIFIMTRVSNAKVDNFGADTSMNKIYAVIFLNESNSIILRNIVVYCYSNGVVSVIIIYSNHILMNNVEVCNFREGITILASNFVELNYMRVKGHKHIGITVKYCTHTKISKSLITMSGYGLSVKSCNLTMLRNVTCERNLQVGIMIRRNWDIYIENVSASRNGGFGLIILEIVLIDIVDIQLDGNYIQGAYIGYSIFVVLNNVFATLNEQHGVRIGNCYRVSIANFTICHNEVLVVNCSGVILTNISVCDTTELFFTNSKQVYVEKSTFSQVFHLFKLPYFDEINIQAIITLKNTSLILRDCQFYNNKVSSIGASDSIIEIQNHVVFENISAISGAAFILSEGSRLILTEKSNMVFRNNIVSHYGAAFYINTKETLFNSITIANLVYSVWLYTDTLGTQCFLATDETRSATARLTFINNTAERGGDVLYGGLVATGYDGGWNCLLSFKNISDMTQQSSDQPFRRITSEPSRVCLCGDQGPDCMTVVDPTPHLLYPGETLSLSLAVVGQDFGTVSGSVYAQLLDRDNQDTYFLNTQTEQTFNNSRCMVFNYTLLSKCDTCESVLVLTTDRSQVLEEMTSEINMKLRNSWSLLLSEADYRKQANQIVKKYINLDNYTVKVTEDYKRDVNNFIDDLYSVTLNYSAQFSERTSVNRLKFPPKIYKYPLYIHIKFRPCPLGFALSNFQCDCINILKHNLAGVVCDIQSRTLSLDGTVWVGVYERDNIAASQYCPFNYCKNEAVQVSLTEHSSNGTDSQCNYNHSGVLCGGCGPGLSLALGSEQCLKCSNAYLSLILPFALAGLFTVFIIKVLDLTVCHGTINVIIFYANVINANKHLFYSQTSVNPIMLFIAWFNLDLGIETCFYDSLTAYARTWLQFVFPVYMWSIAGGIIVLARYSRRVAALSGENGVPVLATLFLLSYAKLLNTIISVLSYTTLHTTQGTKLVWSIDGNVPYLGPQHSLLFVAALVALLFLWLPYTLILLLGRYLNMVNCHFLNRNCLRLKPFLDANYAPFHRRHQYWFGVTLIVKATVLLASATAPTNSAHILVFSVAVSSVILTFWGQLVYQNTKVSLLHTSIFMDLAILNITKLFEFESVDKISAASLTLISLSLITVTAHSLSTFLKRFTAVNKVVWCWKGRRGTEGSVREDDYVEEHRMISYENVSESQCGEDSDTCSSRVSVDTY